MTKHDERHWEHSPNAYAKLRNRLAVMIGSAECLIEKGIKTVGIDTYSPDVSGSNLPVHHNLMEQGILIIEALINLDRLP